MALSRAKRKMVLVASRSIVSLFSPDGETFANALLWKILLLRTGTTLLWEGRRTGQRVAVWGGIGIVGHRTVRANQTMTRIPLPQVVKRLQAHYGKQTPPKLGGPWEMILRENVAYLAGDARRHQALQTLRQRIGTEPAQILSASDESLFAVTRHGAMPEQFADKLRTCAKIVLEEFDGDLRPVLQLPLPKAKTALQKFPGIGEPGAEKILLFTRTCPVLALESNGLRVLLRLGFGEERNSYSATYRLVQKAAGGGLDLDYSALVQAHLLLRRHGQELCRRSEPVCDQCPLAADCEYDRRGDA